MSMDEFSFSMRMRDTIRRMMKESIDTDRPRYRYAKVVSFERVARKCTVIFNGETNPVVVNMGSVQPKQANQIVRVEGIGTDKYISDVIGEAWFNPANVPTPPAYVTPDGGWQDFPFSAGFSAIVGEPARYKVRDGVCYFTLGIAGNAVSPNQIGVFPVGARPPVGHWFTGIYGGTVGEVKILADGRVLIGSGGHSAGLVASGSFSVT